MNKKRIRKIVSGVLLNDAEGFKPLTPKIEIESYRRFPREKFTRVWPDVEASQECLFIRAYLHKMNKKSVDCTSIEFFYREDPASVMVCWFQLLNSLRGQGLGRELVEKLESVADSLKCENRIYISNITNDSFWSYFGYGFYKTTSNDIGAKADYWRKL